ncbi:hypothetical protein ABU614_10810 [Lysobacter firmicutimachus]|uniref:Uncharacterized protein n=1 Tax=Lysobacter firmicutimachus TaxID=1792846 RepID=A0AAU8N174_9GAMM
MTFGEDPCATIMDEPSGVSAFSKRSGESDLNFSAQRWPVFSPNRRASQAAPEPVRG